MPERRLSAIRGKNPQKLSRTLIRELGVDASPASLADSIAQRIGIPILEAIRFEYAPIPKQELTKHVDTIIRRSGTKYSHSKLQGMEFGQNTLDFAISSVMAADRLVMDEDATSPKGELQDCLSKNPAFQKAALDSNRADQMMVALHNTAVMLRKAELLERDSRMDPEEAEAKAREDVAIARTLIDDFRELRAGKLTSDAVSAEADRMLKLHKSDPTSEMSDYELALTVMDAPKEEKPKEEPLSQKVPEKIELVFPFPNFSIEKDLEDVLAERFPSHDAKGDEIEYNQLMRRVARTLLVYKKLETEPEFRSQFAQLLEGHFKGVEPDFAVPQVYQGAVKNLVDSYSPARTIELVAALLDSAGYKPQPKPPPHKEPEKKGPDHANILKKLTMMERRIMAAVLKKKNGCTADDVSHYMMLHAGIRELRACNFIDSLWESDTPRAELAAYQDAKERLNNRCGLKEPTAQQKLEAIAKVHELSDNQKEAVRSFFGLDEGAVTADYVRGFGGWAAEPDKQNSALELWKRNRVNLLTLASLVHSRRFTDASGHPPEEVEMLVTLKQGPNIEGFLEAFTRKTDERRRNDYYPEIQKVFQEFPDVRYSSLASAARRQSELNTMFEFFGLPVEKTKATFDYKNCFLLPEIKGDKDGSAVYKDPCEDTMSSMVIVLDDGRKILLDAVFDGMGGHGHGARAAEIAKDALEISAIAGWIKTPEDVRKAIVVADLSILMEQWESKHDKSNLRRQNNMGTTAVVSFQCGDEFYGIHCGDSEYRVLRGGKTAFKSYSHSYAYEARRMGRDPDAPEVKEMLRAHKNKVTSALGSGTRYININNTEGADYSPFILRPDDAIAVDSDGVNDPLCADHEYPMIMAESKDLAEARLKIVNTSTLRADRKRSYKPKCGCEEREGKNDDKSLMLRYAAEGMKLSSDSITRAMGEEPEMLSNSSDFQALLAGSLPEDRKQAEQFFEKLISAAEAAEEEKRPAAYAFVIDMLFGTASKRSDHAELVECLLPSMERWTEEIIAELALSKDASAAKRRMFDFASRTADAMDFAILFDAENPEISEWAFRRMIDLPRDEKIKFYQACFEKIKPVFNFRNVPKDPHTDIHGKPLSAWQTRYLDSMIFDVHESSVMQETALRLGIRPRDLEIMVFYVYSDSDPDVVFDTSESRSDFNLARAIEPHKRGDISNLIAELSLHLGSDDAGRILEASYYIYYLNTGLLKHDKAQDFSRRLSVLVRSMGGNAPYWMSFANKAELFRHRTSQPPGPREAKR